MEHQFTAPEHLSGRAKALWVELVPKRARSVGRMALLTAALEALDRADEARAAIGGGSLTTTTKTTGAVHIHPLLKVEREARQQFANIWASLNFGFDQAEDGTSFERWRIQQVEANVKRSQEREAAK